MTPTQRLRDRVAELLGYIKRYNGSFYMKRYPGWERDPKYDNRDYGSIDELVGPALDAIAEIWKEQLKGWTWTRQASALGGTRSWFASQGPTEKLFVVIDTGDEYRDRLALTVKCLEAMKGN